MNQKKQIRKITKKIKVNNNSENLKNIPISFMAVRSLRASDSLYTRRILFIALERRFVSQVGFEPTTTPMDTMIPQRGFISLGLTGWIAIGGLAIMAALGLYAKVQTARLDAAQHKVLALEQSVAQWRGAAKDCSDSIKKAEIEAESRSRAALNAITEARKASVSSRNEVNRLKALIGSAPVTDCQAGAAVSKIRQGLSTQNPIPERGR